MLTVTKKETKCLGNCGKVLKSSKRVCAACQRRINKMGSNAFGGAKRVGTAIRDPHGMLNHESFD